MCGGIGRGDAFSAPPPREAGMIEMVSRLSRRLSLARRERLVVT